MGTRRTLTRLETSTCGARRVRALVLGCACALFGCAEEHTRPDASLGDTDAGPSATDAPGRALQHPPPRPSVGDGPDGPSVAFALRDVLLDQGAEWARVGLDLDGLDTQADAPATECASPGAPRRDGEGGIDNVLGGELYPLLETAIPGLEARAREAQEAGRGALVLVVRGWNGGADDPRVEVALLETVLATSAEGATPDAPPAVTIRSPSDVELASGGPLPLPAWDGDDWAWARDDGLLAGDLDAPLVVDADAYVAAGVLVASLRERTALTVRTDDAAIALRLSGATVLARLGPSSIELEAVTIAGRWASVDVLSTAEDLGLCAGSAQREILAAQLDRIADVRSTPPTTIDPGVPCDAISVGVRWRGTRVRIAEVTPGATGASVCAP